MASITKSNWQLADGHVGGRLRKYDRHKNRVNGLLNPAAGSCNNNFPQRAHNFLQIGVISLSHMGNFMGATCFGPKSERARPCGGVSKSIRYRIN